MKTPEEIKKGLECCGNSGKCKGCPYYGGYELCMGTLAEDALAYVQQLEQRLVEVNKTSPRWISVGGSGCRKTDKKSLLPSKMQEA